MHEVDIELSYTAPLCHLKKTIKTEKFRYVCVDKNPQHHSVLAHQCIVLRPSTCWSVAWGVGHCTTSDSHRGRLHSGSRSDLAPSQTPDSDLVQEL